MPTTLMLESEDVWIADTGVSSHITEHSMGGVKQYKSSIQVQGCMGNVSANLEMDIPVTYCDKDGNEIRSAELKDVQVNDSFNVNLFSVTQMLRKGYKLKGDDE